jgi:hypothetical protein
MSEAHETAPVRIWLEDVSVAEASSSIKTLRNELLDAGRSVRANIVQDDPTHQDFGATLVLVLGAQATIAVAKGIADWLSRVGGKATLNLDVGGGQVVKFKGSSADAAAIARALTGASK